MLTSPRLSLGSAAVASREEICELNRFFAPYQSQRPFSKTPSGAGPGYFVPRCEGAPLSGTKRPPFHFLRGEFERELGGREAALVGYIWQQHGLEQFDNQPDQLRPALRRLFSSAARLVATRGKGESLQAVLRRFEQQYFRVNDLPFQKNAMPGQQRLGLLALIQTGDGVQLLNAVLTESLRELSRPNLPNPSPSLKIDEDAARLRREFLFEAAYRSGDWDQAYRQGRLLKLSRRDGRLGSRLTRQFREVCRQLLVRGGEPRAKQKQLLIDLASLGGGSASLRKEYALRAAGSTLREGRPGELDRLLCRLLDPCDPRWRMSLRRLYRRRSSPEEWMNTLRRLWQHESDLRPFFRVLFALLRHSRERAELALSENGFTAPLAVLERGQVIARLNRATEDVARWERLTLPEAPQRKRHEPGYPVQLPANLQDHLERVCHRLGMDCPRSILLTPQFAYVEVKGQDLHLSPMLFSVREEEARFFLARAMFRHLSGLDRLESRGRSLAELSQLAARAAAHCEWMGHCWSAWRREGTEELECSRPADFGAEELQVALEDLFWKTGDTTYTDFAEVLASGGWCPAAEYEADLFASSYGDLVSSTFAVLGSAPGCQRLYRKAQRNGIANIAGDLAEQPILALRLQNLWMNAYDEVQRRRVVSTR